MALKTYLLAPNFTYEPDGPIRIGTIIADPFCPTKALYVPTDEPETAVHTDIDTAFTREKGLGHHHSIWAKFFQTASANIGAGINKDARAQYTMDSLETVRIKTDPTDEEAAELLKNPVIQSSVSAGLFGSAPVYMITGIKIAKGFSMTTSITRTHEAQLGGSAFITEGVSAGAEINGSRRVAAEDTVRSGSDIIFAYQLHIIAQKKWWRSAVSIDTFAPQSAFLSKETKGPVQEETLAMGATVDQLVKAADENEVHLEKGEAAGDGEGNYVWISFEE